MPSSATQVTSSTEATVVDQSGIDAAAAEPMLAIVLDGVLLPER